MAEWLFIQYTETTLSITKEHQTGGGSVISFPFFKKYGSKYLSVLTLTLQFSALMLKLNMDFLDGFYLIVSIYKVEVLVVDC